ncbi:MAG: type III polyketide synthase [Bacteroidia bacterium]
MTYIKAIGTATPPNKISQLQISSFMSNLYDITDEEKKRIEVMYARSGIDMRYSVLDDFSNKNLNNLKPNGIDASIEKRMSLYFLYAPKLAIDAINNTVKDYNELTNITHLITVSCTGMAAPGLDIMLVQQLGLKPNIQRTSVNFMGCYAAIHALKLADAICKSNEKNIVLVVSVELCTIHFQSVYTTDNIAANLLFADGAAACIVGSSPKNALYKINNFFSKLIYNGQKDMAWHLSQSGFLMTLSAYIPDLIEQNINEIFIENNIDLKNINHFAIHPGGRKILDKIKVELNLKENQIISSYNVLRQFGNMSSPTILFVLHDLLNQKINSNEKILAAGFGPGLTVEMFTLETT